MKKWIVVLAALLMMASMACALADEMVFPVYAACTGNRVNVRVNAEEKVPSRGQLVAKAPVVVLSESTDGSCWYCQTQFGEGYVPKQYISLLPDMSFADFAEYCSIHPSRYRRLADLSNDQLLDRYYGGEISKEELKLYWQSDLPHGYYGWTFGKNGDVVFNK